MLYYCLILISVLMFGGGFALQDLYRQKRGSGLKISMESSLIGSASGLIVLLIINGFLFEYTLFTLIMAVWSAINGIAFVFCSFKALDHINLSLFAMLAMLGGMVLPFFQGIFFYGEGFTVAKAVCVFFICLALACTIKKGKKSNGVIFYIGIFVLNGMGAVIPKIFTAGELPKTSVAGYSIWIAICSLILSGLILMVMTLTERKRRTADNARIKRTEKLLWQSYGIGALNGALNKVANFILVIALLHVDTSVQYPMVTGGTMIVSTLLCCFGSNKPNKKEVLSVALAFLGMLALFIIPV